MLFYQTAVENTQGTGMTVNPKMQLIKKAGRHMGRKSFTAAP
jgi:hypothetical protein